MARSFSVFRYDDEGNVIEQDIHLDETGDLAVVSGLEELRQRAQCRLQMLLGEDIFDRSVGLPLRGQVLEQPYSEGIAASVITDELMKLPEVTSVSGVDIELRGRELTYEAREVESSFGTFPVQIG